MPSRALGVLIATWLPCLALILPLSRFHTVNAIVAGVVATALAAFAMVSDRARIGAAFIGAWVAFTPMFVRSSLLELALCSCWGVTMFVSLTGPFSQKPQITLVRQLVRPAKHDEEHDALPIAA